MNIRWIYVPITFKDSLLGGRGVGTHLRSSPDTSGFCSQTIFLLQMQIWVLSWAMVLGRLPQCWACVLWHYSSLHPVLVPLQSLHSSFGYQTMLIATWGRSKVSEEAVWIAYCISGTPGLLLWCGSPTASVGSTGCPMYSCIVRDPNIVMSP